MFLILNNLCSKAQVVYFNNQYDYGQPFNGYPTATFESFQSVISTIDKGYLAVGFSSLFIEVNGSFDYIGPKLYVNKTDSLGHTIWDKIYNIEDSIENFGNSVLGLEDGTFVIAGQKIDKEISGTRINRDCYVIKINAVGDTLWTKKYALGQGVSSNPDFESFRKIIKTNDNGFVVMGYSSHFLGNKWKTYLIKIDSIGNKEWEKIYNSRSENECAWNMIEIGDGYLMTGFTDNTSDNIRRWYILKIDSIGNVIWEKIYGGNHYNVAGGITSTKDGCYIISGGHYISSTNNQGWLVKIDQEGTMLWEKKFGGFYEDELNSPVEMEDGCIVVVGSSKSFGTQLNNSDGWIIKTDPNGNLLWERVYGLDNGYSDYLYDIKSTDDGGFIACGQTRNNLDSTYQNAWLIKADCFGCDSLLCYYEDTICYYYDCSQYPIDAFFTSSADTIDLAFESSIVFSNNSSNTTARHWDFGDGTKAYTNSTKTHTYTQEGTYIVSLKVHHAVCYETFSKEITVMNSTGLNGLKVDGFKFKIVPNPASSYATVKIEGEIKENSKLLVYNIHGKVVKENIVSSQNSIIDLSETAPGIYYCVLFNGQAILCREKLVVVR